MTKTEIVSPTGRFFISEDVSDYGNKIWIQLRVDEPDGSSVTILMTHDEARALSACLWNKTRSPGETR